MAGSFLFFVAVFDVFVSIADVLRRLWGCIGAASVRINFALDCMGLYRFHSRLGIG